MKTFKISIIMLIMSVILLTSCGTKKEEATPVEPAEPNTEEVMPVIEKPEEASELVTELTEKLDDEYDIPQKLRDTLDQYEEFVDTYCAFMVEYANASTDWQVANMETYVKYSQAITKCQTAINDTLERKDELTTDEYDYILLVQTRTATKLLNAASGMIGD